MPPTLPGFPDYSALKTKAKIDELVRLAETDLTNNPFVYGAGIAKLLSAALVAYRNSRGVPRWTTDQFLARANQTNRCFHLLLAALFDLLCNIEYVRGRLVNAKWIYCHREGASPKAFYSFLKQCPLCCLDRGLETRLAGAQHKPSSHHIGEITTTAMALLLRLVVEGSPAPLRIAAITKQSHDVDAIGYSDSVLLLFEIKASPMVNFPLCLEVGTALYELVEGERTEYRQHKLIDVLLDYKKISLCIPHRNLHFPLGGVGDTGWPYQAAIDVFGNHENLLSYFSAWLELFYAYSVPKRRRTAKEQALTYLVNGWGDEIDSNKTKPGLGRTDDIKKGTYQVIKFGAYYHDENASLPVKGVLAANLDPLFLRPEYLDKMVDLRWGRGPNFIKSGDEYRIREDLLYFVYNAILAFNEPVINDPLLLPHFDLAACEAALKGGVLDGLLTQWAGGAAKKT